MCGLKEKKTRRGGDKGTRGQGDKKDLILLVSPSPCLLVFFWGGEVNLRFYPNQPGLPRKPIPSLSISSGTLETDLYH
jgi:hypothetical protein